MIIDRGNGWYTLTSGFTKEFTKLRKSMGITQAELAERTGVSPATICRIEKGKARETTADKIEIFESFFGIRFTRDDDSNRTDLINELENEYKGRINELEEENTVLKKLLMKYWNEEGV